VVPAGRQISSQLVLNSLYDMGKGLNLVGENTNKGGKEEMVKLFEANGRQIVGRPLKIE
jgi:hypothetical protein